MLIHNKRGGSSSSGSSGTIVNYNAVVIGTVTNTATTYSCTSYIEDPSSVNYSDFMIVLNTGTLAARDGSLSVYPVIAYNGNNNAVTAYISGDSNASFTGYLYYIKKNTISSSGTLNTYLAKTTAVSLSGVTSGQLWNYGDWRLTANTWDTGYTIDATNLNYLTISVQSTGSSNSQCGARCHAWAKLADGTVLGSTCSDTKLTYNGRQNNWDSEFSSSRALTSTNCGSNVYLGNNTTSNSCTIDLTSVTGLVCVYFEGQYCSNTNNWTSNSGHNYLTITGISNT